MNYSFFTELPDGGRKSPMPKMALMGIVLMGISVTFVVFYPGICLLGLFLGGILAIIPTRE